MYIVDDVTKTLVKRNLNGGVAGDPYPLPAQALPLKLYDVTLYDVSAHFVFILLIQYNYAAPLINFHAVFGKEIAKTRMHSRRMRTVRSSSHVYSSMHWAGGCIPECTEQGMHHSGHWARGCLPRGSAQGGSAREGLPRGSVQGGSAREGLPRGSVQGVCLHGVCIPAYTLADTQPPMNRMTDRCKNIILPQLRCGR